MCFSNNMKLAYFAAIGAVAAVSVNPMPAPRNISWSGNRVDVSLSMQLVQAEDNDIVLEAFQRVMSTVSDLRWTPKVVETPRSSYLPFPTGTPKKRDSINATVDGILTTYVNITNYRAPLDLAVNESYTLNVGPDSIQIGSETVWGSLHALTTLQQLIVYDADTDLFFVEKEVAIWDEPLFPHRGIMLDLARHFLTVKAVLEQIDILSLVKMNVLHWHITDLQLWPLQLAVYPQMTQDAYSAREVYSAEDIKHIVSYASARGVRVVPEIDMPSHTRAGWRRIDSKLVPCQDAWWGTDQKIQFPGEVVALEPPPGQLDMLYPKTYEVVENIYNEVSELFPDLVFHVGADELVGGCYNYSSYVQEWFKQDSSRTYNDLVQYWVDKAVPMFLKRKDRRLTMWEDVILDAGGAHNVSTDVIMQLWNNGMDNVKILAAKGYDVIVSSGSHLYLDCGLGGWPSNDPRYVDNVENDVFNSVGGGSWCNPYKTWQRIYDYDITANLTDEEKKHVLGAEAPLFLEQVDSPILTQRIWPRTAALAEMTWSGNRDETGHLRTNYVTSRILNFREYLVALGYVVSPLMPQYCVKNPHACDYYRNQTYLDRYGTQEAPVWGNISYY